MVERDRRIQEQIRMGIEIKGLAAGVLAARKGIADARSSVSAMQEAGMSLKATADDVTAMPDVQKMVADLWAGPHVPRVEPQGSQMRLVHPFGPSVAFDMTRADLALPAQEFADRILAQPIAELRKLTDS